MTSYSQSEKNRVQRVPKRGIYDKETIYAIVDHALIGHIGFAVDGTPFVIPTLIVRDEDHVLLHGATSSRLMRHVQTGADLCIAVTLVDGIVLARSAFNHSVNYRSAVLFGNGEMVTESDAKMKALQYFTEHLIPGRWQDTRLPNGIELRATAVARVKINLASAKLRTGPPVDDADDYTLPYWAGVLPIRQIMSEPIPDEQLPADVPIPAYVSEMARRFRDS